MVGGWGRERREREATPPGAHDGCPDHT
jgi:hypothetical protein